MFNKTLLCAAVGLVFSVAAIDAAHAAITVSAPSQPAAPAPVPAGSTILYTQTGASTNGYSAQDFETANNAFDSELADDFTVPVGGWGVNSVNFAVTGSAGANVAAATWNIRFYANNAGVPGAADAGCSYSALAGAGGTAAGGTFTVTLPTQCNLTAGIHWFSAQARLDFTPNGQSFWSAFPAPVVGSSGVFRNPGGGFANGCTAFTAIAGCALGSADPNMIFQLLGRTLPVTLQSYKVD
ncbi:MAG: hypothetical protein ABIP56_06255 [Dokdonella sp.]